MELTLTRTENGLVPADRESAEKLRKLKLGATARAKVAQMRNGKFFRKWFALVTVAFDHWEPGELQAPRWEGVTPEKAFDRFRKDLTILAGYYESSYRLDGSVRIEAQSIAWGNMSEEAFETLYGNTINAVLKHVLRTYTRDDLERVVEQVLRFDS